MTIIYFLLCLLLIYVAVIDFIDQKISNKICLFILATGFFSNSVLVSGGGLITSLYGLIAGLVPLLIIRLITGLGAGDVKLMAAIGSVIGVQSILKVFCYSYLFSGMLALSYLVLNDGVKEMVCRIFSALFQIQLPRNKLGATVTNRKLPMAPGISLATLYVLFPKMHDSLTLGKVFWD